MTMQLAPTAAAYVQSINNHDPAAFNALFADGATVNDIGREFRGAAAIKAWSDSEIFDAQVTLEVIDIVERNSEIVLMSKADGTFDRTGLPNPLILEHRLTINRDKIVALMCGLAAESPHA
jgi:hypothetical protein